MPALHPPISVLVADDNRQFRTTFVRLLRRDPRLAVVGEAGDAREVAEATSRLLPDLVLLDLNMPGSSAAETVRRIGKESPVTAVVIVTSIDWDGSLRAALAAGACGHVGKDRSPSEIVDRSFEFMAARPAR